MISNDEKIDIDDKKFAFLIWQNFVKYLTKHVRDRNSNKRFSNQRIEIWIEFVNNETMNEFIFFSDDEWDNWCNLLIEMKSFWEIICKDIDDHATNEWKNFYNIWNDDEYLLIWLNDWKKYAFYSKNRDSKFWSRLLTDEKQNND